MPPEDMTPEDREAFAARLRLELRTRFGGVAKDAYTAAKVNPATWSNAVNGRPIKPHKRIQIVANLWPETRGDWTQIPDQTPDEPDWAQLLVRRVHELEREVEALKKRPAG